MCFVLEVFCLAFSHTDDLNITGELGMNKLGTCMSMFLTLKTFLPIIRGLSLEIIEIQFRRLR